MKFLHNLPGSLPGGFFYKCTSLGFLLLLPTLAPAQFKFREPPNRRDPQTMAETDGRIVWQNFQRNRAVGTFHLDGRLVYRPLRLPSESFHLTIEGVWSGEREQTLITLRNSAGSMLRRKVVTENGQVRLFDVSTANDDEPVTLPDDDLQQPFIDQLPFTWSDLLMDFLHWEQVEYIGPDRYLGRPAHRFALANPLPDTSPARIVVTVDEDYAALLKAEFYSPDNNLVKRMRIGGFKQFDEEWMFSELIWEMRLRRESIRLDVHSFSTAPSPVP